MQTLCAFFTTPTRRTSGLGQTSRSPGHVLNRGTFLHNGYRNKLIQGTKHKVLFAHKLHNTTHTQNKNSDRENTSRGNQQNKTYISLSYLDETLARRVDGAIRSSGLRAHVAWSSGKTLAKHVIRSALESPPCPAGTKRCSTCKAGLPGHCHTKNVVYKIICNL